MSDRRDDTTQRGEPDAPPAPERAPRSYYYDDATGYEIYDPAKDEAEDEPNEGDGAAAKDDEPVRV